MLAFFLVFCFLPYYSSTKCSEWRGVEWCSGYDGEWSYLHKREGECLLPSPLLSSTFRRVGGIWQTCPPSPSTPTLSGLATTGTPCFYTSRWADCALHIILLFIGCAVVVLMQIDTFLCNKSIIYVLYSTIALRDRPRLTVFNTRNTN